MSSPSDLKTQGNEAFRAGKYEDAIRAYSYALVSVANSPSHSNNLVATIFSNRSAAFLNVRFYQSARADAQDALKLTPNDTKARFRLASALFHLRSYENAFNTIRPLQSSNSVEIQTLLRQLIVCVGENRTGEYDIAKIEEEERQNPRLSHADYCSSFIELRSSTNGGNGGRGIFARALIPQGTLLVGSKAIACGFEDELRSPDFLRSVSLTARHERPSKFALVNDLYAMLLHGCGRGVLNLEGGISQGLDIDLKRDDVYEEDEELPKASIDIATTLILRNSFTIKKTVSDGWKYGSAIFLVPSFFNHSCMPNSVHYHIGDMIFIRSTTTIQKGDEIFLHYSSTFAILNAESVQERNTVLKGREDGFLCRCALCRFEIENPKIVDPAVNIAKNMCEKYNTRKSRGSKKTVEELEEARRKLYKLFDLPIPKYDLRQVPVFDINTPRQFSFATLLRPVISMLVSSLRAQDAVGKSIPYVTELHALVNGNLNFSHETLKSPQLALSLWSHYLTSHREFATVWLEEVKRMCLMVGGKKYYKGKFHPIVDRKIEEMDKSEDSGKQNRESGSQGL